MVESNSGPATGLTTAEELEAKRLEYERRFPKLTLVEDLDVKIDAFTAQMRSISETFMQKIAGFQGQDFKAPEDYKERPRQMTAKKAAKLLLGKKKITLLTGAGISAASGIPTFRGQDGFWKDAKTYAGESAPTEICTRAFFDQNPMATWEWHLDFYKLMVGK